MKEASYEVISNTRFKWQVTFNTSGVYLFLYCFCLLIYWPLPGHPLVLQAWDCKLFPWQSAPPLLGGGLVQARKRVWTPPPHVTLQLPQTSHSDQPPLTVKNVRRGTQCHSIYTSFNIQETVHNPGALIQLWVKHLVPGHPLVLHDWDWKLSPWQSTPPLAGGGLVQVRVRLCTPLPQVRLQPPQGPQFDQPPLTMKEKNKSKRSPLVGALDLKCTSLWFI